jgi:hypothetical protein
VTTLVDHIGHTDHGDVIQPGRDSVRYGDRITHHHYASTPEAVDAEVDGGESSSSGGAAAAKAGSGLGVVVVLAVLGYLIFGGDEPFPTYSDPWPAGVDRAAVISEAGGWLEKCQRSEAANPVNCPQSLPEAAGKVSKVHWAFYGSYLEAPVIQFNEDDSVFDMLGTVVASADYMESKAFRRVVTPIKFWAKISWIDSKLEVKTIREHSAVGDPTVVKVEPRLPWESVEGKLDREFARCLSGAALSLPAGCPDWQLPKDAKKVKWSMGGDPSLTARPVFDPKYGIFRVNGTYNMKATYTSRGLPKSDTRNLDYEALVTTSESGPIVLQIKDAPPK